MAETLRADTEIGPGEADDALRWYACYTRSRAEKQVERLMAERGFEVFLPLVSRVSQWKDRRKRVEFPMFPSYVFGRFSLRDVHRVLSVPGVVSLVKQDGRPSPIADADLENVRRFARALRTGDVAVEARPYLEQGVWVEVSEGPLKGVRGVVVERRGRRRVLIGLKAIGQGMEFDVDVQVLRALPISEGETT
jgi:transcription termination/antitermination protein NusG